MCHSTVAVGFSLVCNVTLQRQLVSLWYAMSLYSGSGFLSGMQCVILQEQWVSLWYAMCHFAVAVGFSLECNVSFCRGCGFFSGMQCVDLQ